MAVRLDPYQRIVTVALDTWGPLVAPMSESGVLLSDGQRYAVNPPAGAPAYWSVTDAAPGWGNAVHGLNVRQGDTGPVALDFYALSGARDQWQLRRSVPYDPSMDTGIGTGAISRRWTALTSTGTQYGVGGWGWEPVTVPNTGTTIQDQPWRPGRLYRDGALVAAYGGTTPNPWGTTTRPYVLGFPNGVVVLPTTLFYKSFIFLNEFDQTGEYNGEMLRVTRGIFAETHDIERPRPHAYRDDQEGAIVLPWGGLDTMPSPSFRDEPMPMPSTDERCTLDVEDAVYSKRRRAWYLLVDLYASYDSRRSVSTGIDGPFAGPGFDYYTQKIGAWEQDNENSSYAACSAILEVKLDGVRFVPGAFAYRAGAEPLPQPDVPVHLTAVDNRLLFIGRDEANAQGLYEYDLTTGDRTKLGTIVLPALSGYVSAEIVQRMAFNQKERLFYAIADYIHTPPSGRHYLLLTSVNGINWSVASTTPIGGAGAVLSRPFN